MFNLAITLTILVRSSVDLARFLKDDEVELRSFPEDRLTSRYTFTVFRTMLSTVNSPLTRWKPAFPKWRLRSSSIH